MKTIITMLVLTVLGGAVSAQNIKLPTPKKSGGKALMDCLNERQTDRNFDSKQLSLQDLSDLVWAANGINRPESGNSSHRHELARNGALRGHGRWNLSL